jgi:glycosyltransferase involved in cell wall biosynthesis
MNICYFGIYKKEYPRNRNILKGLELNGAKIIEVCDTTSGLIKFWYLFKKHWLIRKEYDLMIIGFAGQIIVPFAKLITRKPVVYDLHVSYYDSIVLERRQVKKGTIKAFYYYFLDWLACRLADRILLDTKEHVEYISRLLHAPKGKFIVVYTGINEDVFKPQKERKTDNDKFIISFHGYIQPLNGMDLVVRAMEKLKNENIELWIIGGGPEYGNIRKLAEKLKLKNIIFYGPMPYAELAPKISRADLGLGFFSQSKKIDRVIANKVYELMAMKIPVLTGTSIGTAEQFKHREHIYYCQRGSVEAISEAILGLRNNKDLRDALAKNAYNYVRKELNPKMLGKKLLPELEKLII